MASSFGRLLRELRRQAGVTQRELAAKAEVDFSYISKVENDRVPSPAVDTIEKICSILGAPPDELLALAGKVPSKVTASLGSSAAALQFMRLAQSMKLTDDEWQRLARRLKALR